MATSFIRKRNSADALGNSTLGKMVTQKHRTNVQMS